MKLLHLSDLHLGRSMGDFDLKEDQEYILERILETVSEQSVDAVLIAGDVYDKIIPSEAATRMLDSFLCRLAAKKVKTFLISGNHDSDDRLNFGSRLFAGSDIFISAVFDGKLHKQTITDGKTEADVYMLPFVKASQVRRFFPDASIDTYEDAVRTVIESAKPDPGRVNILIAHQFVSGKGTDPALGGSESVGTQSVGLVEKIGYTCFDGFDYVALGHIHSPQSVGRDTVRYAGSPLKYSVSEEDNSKSLTMVTIDGKGNITTDLLPVVPKRDLRHIRGKMKDLLKTSNIGDTGDFIHVTLTDEETVNDAMSIFQATYPYTVRIDYDNSRTNSIKNVDVVETVNEKTFEELITDFYTLMYGCDISEEEMKIMREVAGEAGVIHEAD